MKNEDTLFVPMHVEGWVVNQQMLEIVDRDNQGYEIDRFSLNYKNLEDFNSPEHSPSIAGIKPGQGVYLHWQLPKGLLSGVQSSSLHDETSKNNDTGNIVFPRLPNRWLITRTTESDGDKKTSNIKSWLVESNYKNTESYGSPYPNADLSGSEYIGRTIDLSSDTDTDHSTETPEYINLTAVSSGEITYFNYQPYSQNIVSIYDDLSDFSPKTSTKLSCNYQVIGWYADSNQDPLHIHYDDGEDDGLDYQKISLFNDWFSNTDDETDSTLVPTDKDKKLWYEVLQRYDWHTSDNEFSRIAKNSVYHGNVYHVNWENAHESVISPAPTIGAQVAIGNTGLEAIFSLLESNCPSETDLSPLLAALSLNNLSTLDTPDLLDDIATTTHTNAYSQFPGAVHWAINNLTDNDIANIAPFADQLDKLNETQRKIVTLEKSQASSQRNLYSVWFRRNYYANNHIVDKEYKELLNQFWDNQLSLANETMETEDSEETDYALKLFDQKIAQLENQINNTTDQLKKMRDSLAASKTKLLKQKAELTSYPDNPFFAPADPVVLIAGIEPTRRISSKSSLYCRYRDELVVTTNIDREPDLDSLIKAANLNDTMDKLQAYIDKNQSSQDMAADLIPAIQSVLLEFMTLNPAQSEIKYETADDGVLAISSDKFADGTTYQLDNIARNEWNEQPWTPLFLDWSITMYESSKMDWRYDSTHYSLDQNPSAPYRYNNQLRQVHGTTPLSHDQHVTLYEKLKTLFHHQIKDPDVKEDFETQMEALLEWDVFSQSLGGLYSQLAKRDTRMQRRPLPDSNEGVLLGTEMHSPANAALPNDKWLADNADAEGIISNYVPVTKGHFTIESLKVIDTFGQVMNIIGPKLKTPLTISRALTTKTQVIKEDDSRRYKAEETIQITPKIHQAARLNFDWSTLTSSVVGNTISPEQLIPDIHGWITPNYYNRTLEVFSPDGCVLGKLMVVENDKSEKIVAWISAGLQDLTSFKSLDGIVKAIKASSEAMFNKWFTIFDNSFSNIEQSSDTALAMMLGRPLVFIETTLSLQCEKPAYQDPAWEYTFTDNTQRELSSTFPVNLGSNTFINDGLIGYFRGDDYSTFYSVYGTGLGTKKDKSFSFRRSNKDSGYLMLEMKWNEQIDSETKIPIGNISTAVKVTLLFDPRHKVHAYSGILPVKSIQLAPAIVDAVVKNMQTTFEMGPLFTTTDNPVIQEAKDDTEDKSVPKAVSDSEDADDDNSSDDADNDTSSPEPVEMILLPLTADSTSSSKWAWLQNKYDEKTKETTSEILPIAKADTTAKFPPGPYKLTEGLLQWMKPESSSPKTNAADARFKSAERNAGPFI